MKNSEEILLELKPGYFDYNKQIVDEAINEAYNDGIAYLTDITHRNYEATKLRELISEDMMASEFANKLYEEVNELNEDPYDEKELADIALVCFAMAEHYGIDLIEEMRKKTEFNETRP